MPDILNKSEVILIAAVSENGVIGKKNALPWYLPEDLKRFRRLTLGHPIIMGRKTYGSIGRVLPKRRNIIITRDQNFKADGVETFQSIEAAFKACQEADKVFIIGGGEIFKLAMPFAQKIEMTRVHKNVDGDVYFPEIKAGEWQEISREPHESYSFITYERRPR